MLWFAGAALALAAGASTAACGLVAGLDGNFRAAPDAGPEGGPDGGPDGGPSGCVEATYPDPPGGVDGVDIAPIVVAIHSIDLGDMGTVPGYDLDHACTCIDDAGPTCMGASTQPSTYCDAPGGVDNQFSKFVQLLELPLGSAAFGSADFSAKANSGEWTLLLQVTGYDGAKNDPSVQVALFPAAGLGTTPNWDGTDSWPILDTSEPDAGAPAYVSDGAYVADQTLVATVPSVPITLAGEKQTITLTLSSAVLTGKLVQSNGTWRIVQGVLAARLGLTDLFHTLSSYRDDTGAPLCTNSGLIYTTAKSGICIDADITLDGTAPPTAPCDAVSFGMGFTADAALIGPRVPAAVPTAGCAPMFDPATDSCGN